MSTTTHYGDALADYADAPHRRRPGRWLATLRTVWEGVSEGFAASRRYQELTSRGMSHDEAATKVFVEHFGDR